jgi:hypothetical protein
MAALLDIQQFLQQQSYIDTTEILMESPIAILDITFKPNTSLHTMFLFANNIPNNMIRNFFMEQDTQYSTGGGILQTLWIHVKDTYLKCGAGIHLSPPVTYGDPQVCTPRTVFGITTKIPEDIDWTF